MMTKFSLYTEKKNIHLVRHQVATLFNSFTMLQATGYWHGKRERSLIVEVLTDIPDIDRIIFHKLARAIKRMNRQDCVLVTEQIIEVKFL